MALSKLPRQKLNPNGLLLMVLLQALTGSRMVLNGASDLFFEVFGPDVGCHARSSMGVNGLAARPPVEVERILEIEKERLT